MVGCNPFAAPPPTPTTEPPAPTIAPAAAPTAIRPPAPTASPAPKPTATPEPAAESPTAVWIGNTDGQGVYIRKTPTLADRVRAYPDGTRLEVIGEDVDADGQTWKNVRTPDGLEGYVPAIYTVDTQP